MKKSWHNEHSRPSTVVVYVSANVISGTATTTKNELCNQASNKKQHVSTRNNRTRHARGAKLRRRARPRRLRTNRLSLLLDPLQGTYNDNSTFSNTSHLKLITTSSSSSPSSSRTAMAHHRTFSPDSQSRLCRLGHWLRKWQIPRRESRHFHCRL